MEFEFNLGFQNIGELPKMVGKTRRGSLELLCVCSWREGRIRSKERVKSVVIKEAFLL